MATAKATKSKKKTTKNGSVNKAEEIRKAAKEIGGKKVRPKAVIELLANRGIEVSSPQVSSTLKAAGYRRIRHRKAAPTPVPQTASARAGCRSNTSLPPRSCSARRAVSRRPGRRSRRWRN